MATAEGDYVVGYTFEDIERMATDVLKHTDIRPTVGVVCGTGLGALGENVENPVSVPYKDIPGFPICTVKGHVGKFVIGTMGDTSVVMMIGRFHYYEGYPLWKCAMPIRVMKAMGVKTLLVTNAAGGVNSDYKVGDIMIIKDHIDLPGMVGTNVLRGKHDDRFGRRFLATNTVYDVELRQKFRAIASDMGLTNDIKEGIYVYTTGPTFISTMEVKLIKMYGADAIGMSTVPETIVGKQSGMRVFAFSLITDVESVDDAEKIELTHEEVLEAANQRAVILRELMQKFLTSLSSF